MVWTAGVTLAPSNLLADTFAYAESGGGFGTIDLNTGIFTKTLQLNAFNYGLGVANGNLYGDGGPSGFVYQINPSTGAVTVAPNPYNLNGTGFGSTTAGLFLVQAGNPANLYSIDPITGKGTLIGSTGILAGGGTGALSVSNDSVRSTGPFNPAAWLG